METDRKEYYRQYYLNNKIKLQHRMRLRYQKNKDNTIKKASKWRKENPERYKLLQTKGRRIMSNHIIRLWHSMNRRVITQNSYKGRKIHFNRQWFIDFCNDSQEYKKLFSVWAREGYPRKLVPTVDRIDNSKGYTKTNIQFLSFRENSHKKYYDNRNIKFNSV